jgi:hypothetical protein
MRIRDVSFWGIGQVFCLLLLLEAQVLELGWTMTFAVLASFSFSDLAKREQGKRLKDEMVKNENTYHGNGMMAYTQGEAKRFHFGMASIFLPSTHTHHKPLQMNI